MRAFRWTLFIAVLFASLTLWAAETPRVFVTDSNSWEMKGGVGGSDSFGGSVDGGARPQTAEIIKTIHERCPNVIVTNRREKSDYVMVLDHEGGKSPLSRDNKIVVFHNTSGDALFSRSTRSLGNAVKDACGVIFRDSSRRAAALNSNAEVEASVSGAPAETVVPGNANGARVFIDASVRGADVEIDGKFVGNTPSSLVLTPGDHTVVVRKNGYMEWERTVHVTGGSVNLIAELAKQ